MADSAAAIKSARASAFDVKSLHPLESKGYEWVEKQ
jgi:hypothetical protein